MFRFCIYLEGRAIRILLKDQMCGVRERDLGPEQLKDRMVINWDGEENKFGNSYQQPILDVDFK